MAREVRTSNIKRGGGARMKRGEFYTYKFTRNGNGDIDKTMAVKVNGYILKRKNVGFYRWQSIMFTVWISIDLKCGKGIASGNTLQETVENTEILFGKVQEEKLKPEYESWCAEFAKKVEEAKREEMEAAK
jgi:hypothetical protein